MAPSDLKRQIGREVKRALSDAGVSVAEAARRMPPRPGAKRTEPKLIHRWIKGEVFPELDRLEELAEKIEQPITLRLGPGHKENAPPEWVERMLAGVMALEESGQISGDALARAQAKAAAYLAVTPRERPRQEGGGDGVASSS